MREREGKTKRRTIGVEMETERTTPLHGEDGLKEKVRNNEEATKQKKEIETRKESLQEFKMKCLTCSDVIALIISLFHSHHNMVVSEIASFGSLMDCIKKRMN